ncbi:MAG: TIGR03792 family protein [Pseudomonadota bacterium]
MIIEHLTVSIPAGTHTAFLAHDAAIWTATLAAQPGFAGKETWLQADDPTRVHLIIRWDTREQWKAIPQALLAQTDAAMAAAFGRPVPVLSCTDCEVIG